jgi:excisionase family DNA binding protein
VIAVNRRPLMKGNTRKKRELVAKRRQAAEVMSVEEVAGRLGIGRNQAYALVQLGQIPALRFGRRWLIPRATVDRLLAGKTVTA